ncbi:MAG TPA: type II secretion system protein [Paucimonas sp.]|nr:type II secretion system protein [Paucimonas sp.]
MSLVRALPRTAGFSLIELLVSAAILGLLATVAMPLAEVTVRRQKEHDLRLALRDIRQAIDAYKAAAASGKIALATGESGYPPTLTDLVAGVKNASDPEGPKLYFLRRVPRDPFNADAKVAAVDSWGLRSFASPADKPAEGDDVYDVYSLSPETGLNGVPYSEW